LRCGGNPADTSCTLPMDRFVGEPYNLLARDLVEVRVSAANVRGQGLPSPPVVNGA
jgi:hypothetical protein